RHARCGVGRRDPQRCGPGQPAHLVPGAPGAGAMTDLDAVRTVWSQTWPQALTAWGRFTRLRPPRLLPEATGSQEPLRDSLAWFNLLDVEVSVNLETIIRAGV